MFFHYRITNADPAMVHQQLEELRMKELVAYMEDGRKVVRHVLADDKTGLLKQRRSQGDAPSFPKVWIRLCEVNSYVYHQIEWYM